jgi:predicted CopG family antitoxin
MGKTVRLDEEAYMMLSEYAGRLQAKLKRPVSMNEAIKHLAHQQREPQRISDLAGSWRVSDEEVEEIREGLRRVWERWTPKQYV